MSRQTIPMVNGDTMTIGYDEPFDTWFAYLHKADSRHEADVVIGYHPAEVALAKEENPNIVVGPFPVADPKVLCEELIPEWFGQDDERRALYTPLEEQPDCYSCRKPPWESNPGCPVHPYNRLHP